MFVCFISDEHKKKFTVIENKTIEVDRRLGTLEQINQEQRRPDNLEQECQEIKNKEKGKYY